VLAERPDSGYREKDRGLQSGGAVSIDPSMPRPFTVLLCTLVLLALPASAMAAHPHRRHRGPLGAVRIRPPRPRAAAAAVTPLKWNGGPVMHQDNVYVVYWDPKGLFSSTYKSLVNRFLGDVAADSGKSSNVYANDTQYFDSQGAIAYDSKLIATTTDTAAYPSNGCPDLPAASVACLSDSQLHAELDSVIDAHHWPRGMGSAYFMLTPKGVHSCWAGDSSYCAYSSFCAYHSWYGSGSSTTLYANMPFAGSGLCSGGQQPNGDDADALINLISHEQIEMITDPVGNGWTDGSLDGEIGDKCGWLFGDPLGGGSGAFYNQLINGHRYMLQEEFSNLDSGCVQRPTKLNPTAAFTAVPSTTTTGTSVAFDASGSSSPGGSIVSYDWNFGDGSAHGSGVSPSHVYTSPGSPVVTLTVTDSSGASSSTSKTLSVSTPSNKPPSASFAASPNPATTGHTVTFDGSSSSDSDGSIVSYDWDFGDGSAHAHGATASHSYSGPGIPTVTLTVTDNSGNTAVAKRTLTVSNPLPTPNLPPVAAFTAAPVPSAVGQTVRFDAGASHDLDGSIVSYEWDFGDGSPHGHGAVVNHAFSSTGTPVVTLLVTDNSGGTGSASQRLTIGSAGSGAGPASVSGASFKTRSASARGSAVTVLVSCPASAAGGCAGTVKLTSGSSAAATVVIGSAKFKLAAGHSAKLRVHIGRRGLRLLKRRHKLRVLATVVTRSATGSQVVTQAPFTLKAPRRR
jgi:PKD repeat protein